MSDAVQMRCECLGCNSGTHARERDGKHTECLARYSDSSKVWQDGMRWKDGICPACSSQTRTSAPTHLPPPK
jgi:hypothetical protein